MNRNIYLYLIYITALFGCSAPKQDNSPIDTNSITSVNMEDDSIILSGNPIDFSSRKVLTKVFILNRDGAAGRESANKEGKVVSDFGYGGMLEVIEDTGEWYGVADRVTRGYMKNGSEHEVSRWEKVYILKSDTGPYDSIGLNEFELNACIIHELNGSKIAAIEESHEREYFSLELIPESVYLYQKSKVSHLLINDKTGVIETSSELKLPLTKGYKVYNSIPLDSMSDDTRRYDYEGVFPSLNAYLIYGHYYENHGCILVDKNTGEELANINDYPALSRDSKYIACIQANPYNGSGDFELYVVRNHKIEPLIKADFSRWMPVTDKENLFWGDDGALYIKLNHLAKFWLPNGSQNPGGQYAKMTIKKKS